MWSSKPIGAKAFAAVENIDINIISGLTSTDLRPFLPCLVRMSLCAPLDSSLHWSKARNTILKNLSGIELVNNLVGLLSVDFQVLELDARKEQQLRYLHNFTSAPYDRFFTLTS